MSSKGIGQHKLEDYKEAFKVFDQNGDGRISF
jgi:Ca2+-binding EF-hand superfamily protein